MLQFLITAQDGTDPEAPLRRRQAQEAHVSLGNHMIGTGNVLFSTAILDDHEEVCGSMRVMQFESRAELDARLEREPYVTGDVWKDINVKRCRMGPAFEWVTLESGEIRLDEG